MAAVIRMSASACERNGTILEAVGDRMPAGYGAGDSAALHFVGTELAEVVSSRPGARAAFVAPGRRGGSIEHELPVRYLGAPAVHALPEPVAVAA